MSALERLREDMKAAVNTWILAPTPNGEPVAMADVVDTLTDGWRVELKLNRSTRERHYVITTPRRPATALEKLRDEARAARDEWVYRVHDPDVPPPLSVSTLDLLDQREWWIDGNKRTVRLTDMTPRHRMNLLAHLRNRALGLQMEEWTSGLFDHAPDEVADLAADEDPQVWLGRQPFVRRLKKLIRRDRRRTRRKWDDYAKEMDEWRTSGSPPTG